MALPSPLLFFSLVLTIGFGAVALSVGINSLEKSNDEKEFVREHAPAGASVNIDTSDVFNSGIIITVISGLLALTSFVTLLYISFRPLPTPSTTAKRTRSATRGRLLASAGVHLLLAVWVLAALIPFDVFARNRSAIVTASIGGTQLPDAIVQQQQAALGVTAVYWKKSYLRINAILPWFAVLFGLTSAALLLRAARRTVVGEHTDGGSVVGDAEKEESV